MKILYIANVRMPTEKAHGLQIMKMCEAFAAGGAEVELLLPSRRNRQFKDFDPFVFYQITNKFNLIKLPAYDPVWLLKLPSGIYIKFQSVIFCLSLLFYFLKKTNREADIIYTRDEYLLPWLRLFSKRVVWEAHNLPKRRRFYLKFWRRCHKIISITQGLKNELIKIGVTMNKILVAPDGVDLESFKRVTESQEMLRKKLDLAADKKIIMYAGHLYDWKGADVLAEAAGSFSGNELFVFVGGTDREVAEFKNKYGNKKNILIVGHVNHEQIPFHLKAADILVLPNSAKKNISQFYTSPLKLFEYMAAKKPIVASDLPSLREIIDDACAILVEPDSSDALATGIKKLLADDLAADSLAEKAYLKVEQYSWFERSSQILNFIK